MAELHPQPGNLAAFAEWIAQTPVITHPVALETARAAFEDTIACMIAGAGDPATLAVAKGVSHSGTGPCPVGGQDVSRPAEVAALVNATAAHALDFDDNFLPAVTHASAVLVPALLALGAEVDANGDDLLDAYVVGLEMQAWLGHFMIPAHYGAGWHATSTIGAIGAAAACARLLDLDREKTTHALSIACSMAGGSKVQFGTLTKPLHAGLAARAGIAATRLAEGGVTANPDPVFGDWGIIALQNGNQTHASNKRSELSIVVDGLAQKRFPCCGSAHRSLDAIIYLRTKHDLKPDQIDRIETEIPGSNYDNLRFPTPKTASEARFSMTYCGALAMIFGQVRLSDFTADAVMRPEVRSFMDKIAMQDAGLVSRTAGGIWDCPARTSIFLRTGEVLQKDVMAPVGTINTPLSAADIDTKFSDCTDGKTGPGLRAEIRAICREIRGYRAREILRW
ncbi:MAG: MmgE/PrpD family protein [Rhodobacteraceae bacterium]|nr:MmgE/PrpD family protein [Paracoccaceae bacterium]